jgi:hypothetical protein
LKNPNCFNKCILLFLCSTTLYATTSISNPESRYLSVFQYADVAGMGYAVGHGHDTLTIDVKHYWTGSFPTNPVSINAAFGEWTDEMVENAATYYNGKTIVFFATTNDWKVAVPMRPLTEYMILDNSVYMTNSGGFCTPKFVSSDPPTWFTLETNDWSHITFFSNIVASTVVARNRDLLYTTLRDAIREDETGTEIYSAMSLMPMMELLWTSNETNLVEALYDPLLPTRFRKFALSELKSRFDWPATNTIPIP